MVLPNLFFFLLNLILISRLILTFKDQPRSKKTLCTMIVIQLLGLLFITPTGIVIVFALSIILANIVAYWREKNTRKVVETRLISLIFYIIALGIFLAPWAGLNFNPSITSVFDTLSSYLIYFDNYETYQWGKILILSFGMLFIINEANLIVRYVFQFYRLSSKTDPKDKAQDGLLPNDQEYNAGRVIGILERMLIYFFVINAQFSAIGFILAAKGLARFKELENRNFAEYVLIGTLLSALLAMLVAGLTLNLLPE